MRALLVLLVFAFGCAKKPVTSTTLHGDGFTAQISATPFSVKLINTEGATLLETTGGAQETLDQHTYEAQIVPGWDGYRSHERDWRHALAGTLDRFDDHSATLTLTDDTLVVTVTLQTDGPRLKYRHAIDASPSFNKAALAFVMPDDSHFFGLGQRTATVDHLGQTLYS